MGRLGEIMEARRVIERGAVAQRRQVRRTGKARECEAGDVGHAERSGSIRFSF